MKRSLAWLACMCLCCGIAQAADEPIDVLPAPLDDEIIVNGEEVLDEVSDEIPDQPARWPLIDADGCTVTLWGTKTVYETRWKEMRIVVPKPFVQTVLREQKYIAQVPSVETTRQTVTYVVREPKIEYVRKPEYYLRTILVPTTATVHENRKYPFDVSIPFTGPLGHERCLTLNAQVTVPHSYDTQTIEPQFQLQRRWVKTPVMTYVNREVTKEMPVSTFRTKSVVKTRQVPVPQITFEMQETMVRVPYQVPRIVPNPTQIKLPKIVPHFPVPQLMTPVF